MKTIVIIYFLFLDIDLKFIMAFNKIKTLTNKKQDIIEALNDSNVIEFSENFEMIKKKNIIKEFIS